MPTGPSLSKIPSKLSDFNFSSLRPLIRGGLFLKSLSGLSEWSNLLYFFIQASGWSQIFRIYKEIENQTTLNKVMAPGNWCKKNFLIIFAQNAKKPLFHANFNEIWLTNHVFNVSQSLFWFCICTWLCFLHFQKIFIKIAINWVFTVRFKKFKSLYNFSPFLFNLLWKIRWRTLFWSISNQKKDVIVICIEIRRKIVKNWVFIMKKPKICQKLRSLSWLLSTRKVR